MKSTLFALSLIACGQPGNSDDAEMTFQDDPELSQTLAVAQINPTDTQAGSVQLNGQEVEQDPPEEPVLTCGVGSWMGELGPETYRIHIFETQDGHRAQIQRALTHDPSMVFEENNQSEVEVAETDGSLDIYWPEVGMYLWQQNEGERIWEGYSYGFEQRVFLGDLAPPPCGGTQITCWDPQTPTAFHYDPGYGTCVNDKGEEGRAWRDMIFVRETKNGECADLRWASPTDYMDAKVKLQDWNLRGADLSEAYLGNAHIMDARLEGAQLEGIHLDGGSIGGSIDWMTVLPEDICEDDSSEAFCAL